MRYLIAIFVFVFLSINIQAQQAQQLKLAESYEKSGDFESAARIYEQLMQNDPSSEKYFAGFVRANKALSRFSYILKYVQERIKSYESPELYILLGELYWRTGKVNEANNVWLDGLEKYEDYMNYYLVLSNVQVQLQLYDKAINTLKTGRDNLGDDNLFSDDLTKLYIATGDYISGTSEVLDKIQRDKDLALAQGRLYALMVNDEATKYIGTQLKELADSKSREIMIQMLYSWYLRTSGQLEQALEIVKRIDDMLNSQGRELVRFADESRRDGQYDIALKAYSIVIDKGPRAKYAGTALYGYARTLETKLKLQETVSLEEIEAIISRYEMIIETFPNTNSAVECRIRLADIYIDLLGDYDNAEKELLEVSNGSRNLKYKGIANYKLGEMKLMQGNIEEAASRFQLTVKNYTRATPVEADKARYMLAEIEFFQGNIDTARKMFRDVAVLSKSESANNALERLSILDHNKELVRALRLFAEAEYMLFRRLLDEAIEKYNEVINISAGSDIYERSLIKVAEINFKKNNFEATIELCNRLLENNEKTIYGDKALILAGDASLEMQKTDEAEKYYLKILSDYPKSIFLAEARKKIRAIRQQI